MKLRKCIDSKIGDGMKRGLSGGERKRVSIACELVTDPYLFLLDEPTTGLDSENAENVVGSLRTLAGQGKLVVTTIHQPSSEVLAMFDKIIILHGGVKVYDGPFESMKPWFLERGFRFPQFANPCEFIMNLLNLNVNSLEILTSQVNKKFEDIYSPELIEKMRDWLQESQSERQSLAPTFPVIDDDKRSERNSVSVENMDIPLRPKEISKKRQEKLAKKFIDDLLEEYKERKHSAFYSFSVLMSRGWLQIIRNTTLTLAKLIMFIAYTIIIGICFWRMGYDRTGIQNRKGLVFSIMTFVTMVTLQFAIIIFTTGQDLMIKELSQGLYGIGPHYMTLLFAHLPINMLMILPFSIVWFFIANMNFVTQWHLLIILVIHVLNYFCCEAWSTLVSILAGNSERSLHLSNIIFFMFVLFAGFFINDQDVNVWMSPFKYLSFMRWLFKMYLKNEFTNIDNCEIKAPSSSICQIVKENGADGSWWFYGGVLIGQTVIVKLCGYCLYRYKMRAVLN
jgi:ABC-type multidrug transport system ATPase subunit